MLEAHGAVRVSGVANISDAMTLFGRNATVSPNISTTASASPAIRSTSPPCRRTCRPARPRPVVRHPARLSCRRPDAGGHAAARPQPSLIVDLNDGSVLALAAATYSLADNVTLAAGVQAPIGRARTSSAACRSRPSRVLLAPPGQIYLQLRRYF